MSCTTPAISAALHHVCQSVAKCRQSCEELVRSFPAQPIRSVGIVGAGIMGTAIAREYSARGCLVVLCDTDTAALRRAASACDAAGINFTLSASDLNGCDYVLESIPEKRSAKEALYRQLGPHLAKGAVLATNTSAIPVTRLAAGLAAPDRYCGMHFCHPVRQRPLIEIIPGAETSRETLAAVTAHALFLGKVPLVVRDGPGFVVNRLLHAYLNTALDLLAGGMAPHDIDITLEGFGMPMGPLAQLDEIGLDTALASGVVLSEVAERRSPGTELLLALVKARQFGMKSGAGVFLHPGKCVNPILESFLNMSRAERDRGPAIAHPSAPQLLAEMLSEAKRLLAEKMAAASWQVDLASIFGLGMPCWRGGLCWWAENGIE
jgi:3-hydroxyacyl-CoA dehydrogenase